MGNIRIITIRIEPITAIQSLVYLGNRFPSLVYVQDYFRTDTGHVNARIAKRKEHTLWESILSQID